MTGKGRIAAEVGSDEKGCDIQTQGNAVQRSRSFGKLSVPRPVTGSHPGCAEKPLVPQPGLLPEVMSLNAPEKLEL